MSNMCGKLTIDKKSLVVEESPFQLTRHQPSADLAFLVEHYWIVTWDFRGRESYLVEILPHPRVHLVIEPDQSRVFGVVKGKFSYRYEECGQVFGVRFKPGAICSLMHDIPVSQLTNISLSIEEIFGRKSASLLATLLSQEDNAAMIASMEQFLRERFLPYDEQIEMARQMFDAIVADREITRVDDIVKRFNFSKRTVQRLFHQYIGVGPKWVIQHYRLHDVVRRLAEGHSIDWSQLAFDLGYCDQAHFSKEFKAMLGKPPGEYAKAVGTGSSVSSTCVVLHRMEEA